MIRNEKNAIKERPHYRLQKTTLGVASVLLSTTLYFGLTAHADTVQPANANDNGPVEAVDKTVAKPFDANQANGQSTNGANSKVASETPKTAETPTPANQNPAPANPKPVADSGAANPAADKSAAAQPVNAPKASEAPKAADPAELTKTITRTINIADPVSHKTNSVKQTVTYTRENAGAAWTSTHNTFDAYTLPKLPGYTAYDADGGNAVINGSVGSVVTTANMENLIVNVGYRKQDGSTTINLVDENGQVVANQVLTGQTGAIKNVIIQVPDGYVLNEGQGIPTQVTINGNQTLTVAIHALKVTVSHDHPQAAGTIIPGTKSLHFPSGLTQNDLNREVTRSIEVTKADGTKQTITQPAAEFHRDATVNAVTGVVKYGDWNQANVTIPAYHVDVPNGQALILEDGNLNDWVVNPNTISVTIHVRLIVSDASVAVQFMDPDGNEIDEATVSGVVGQSVATNLQVPAGYQLAPGQTLPTTIKLTSTNQDPIVIKVVEGHVTVTPDDPKTSDDVIPGTDDFYNYPDGVTKDDLNKDVIRDIYVKLGNGEAEKVSTQTVKASRSADVNIIEGTVDYGDWSKGSFDMVTAPTENNWVADQASAPTSPIEFDKDGNPVNQAFTFTYHAGTTANADTKQIERDIYVQKDNGQAEKVDSQQVTITRHGVKNLVTGETQWGAWEPVEMPTYAAPEEDGYTVTNPEAGQAMSVDGSQDVIKTTFKYKANVQTIHIIYKDGNQIIKTVPVTGKTGAHVQLQYDVPENYHVVGSLMTSYTFMPKGNRDIVVKLAHNTSKATDTKDINRVINIITPNGKTILTTQTAKLTRQGVKDDVTGKITWGEWTQGNWNRVAVPTVPGYTASTKEVPSQVVTSETQPSEINITYTANENTVNIVYKDNGQVIKTVPVTGKTGQTIDVKYDLPNGYETAQGENLPKTYTFNGNDGQQIVVNMQHMTTPVKDSKTITRTITITTPDGKTKKISQPAELTRQGTKDNVTGKITWGDWTKGNWDQVAVPTVPGYTPSVEQVPSQVVTSGTQPSDVKITYTANQQTVKVIYQTPDGKPVKTATITGKTGETVKMPAVPNNYHVTSKVPSEVTMKPGMSDMTITVEPNTSATSESKTITRTINVKNPDGTVKTTKQAATLTRQGSKNEATSQITWGAWTTGNWESFNVPAMKGYTPSQSVVAAQAVNSETKDETINITYGANEQSTKVIYQTPDGKPVKTETITGKTGETVKMPSVPNNYHVTNKVPSEVTMKPGMLDMTITVEPNTSATSESKTITRTINVNNPDGTDKATKQVVTLTRQGSKNEATGQITWDAWTTGNWESFNVPEMKGYTPSQSVVAAQAVNSETKDETINITYNANEQSIKIIYQTPDGKPVKTETITGKTGETVKMPSVPNNYHATGKVPSEVTMKPGMSDMTITVEPNTSATSESKTITRTINVKNPDGTVKATKQVVTLTRQGSKNEATGQITWDAWTTDNWESFNVPEMKGYTPSQSVVAAQAVNSETKDEAVNITYSANEQSITIIYQTPDGKPVKTETITGKTGETVKIPNDVPSGYHTTGKVPGEVTINGKGNPDIVIAVVPNAKPTESSNKSSEQPVQPAAKVSTNAQPSAKMSFKSGNVQAQPKAQAKSNALPQTGNVNAKGAVALGISGMLVGLGSLLGFKNRED